ESDPQPPGRVGAHSYGAPLGAPREAVAGFQEVEPIKGHLDGWMASGRRRGGSAGGRHDGHHQENDDGGDDVSSLSPQHPDHTFHPHLWAGFRVRRGTGAPFPMGLVFPSISLYLLYS